MMDLLSDFDGKNNVTVEMEAPGPFQIFFMEAPGTFENCMKCL